MSDPFVVRHYVPEEDLSELSQLLTEIEAIDCDGEDTSEEALRAALSWPNYHPAQGVWVAEAAGKLVGYGVALERPAQECTIYVVVHPSQRRKGLGTELLALALNRARELGAKKIIAYANERNKGSDAFLNHQGFRRVGSSGSLKLTREVENPEYEFPKGFTLRTYSEVNDPLILLKALYDCYLGMWGHGHEENPSEEERKSPQFLKYFDPENIFLLFDEQGTIFGICCLRPKGKQDANGEWLDILDGPGIISAYREQDYQRSLVLMGIQHLRQEETRPIVLEFWGDNETALNSYRSLGFEMVNHYLTYHKELE